MKLMLSFWRVVLVLTILFSVAAMFQIVEVARSYNVNILHSVWFLLLLTIGGMVALGVILLSLLSTKWKAHILEIPEAIIRFLGKGKYAAVVIFIVLLPVFSFVTLHPYLGRFYANGSWTHLALFWWLSLGLMVCLRTIRGGLSLFSALWIGALISAVIYIVVKQFITVTNYPFALTWSEAGRFYGTSLFFSKRIYGMNLPLGIMHATWHFLLAIPFLFGNLPIWVHRLWWAFLALVLGVAVSWALANRLKPSGRSSILIATGWIFLFLFPLPLLVNLLFCTLLIMWGVKPGRFWRTTMIVVAASIWAGLSRVNWFPVPGIFAAVLYLLEIPYKDSRNVIKYLWKPIFWILGGTLVSLTSNLVYMQLSGNGAGVNFTSSLTSDLLWYRLLPNLTYPEGILPDLLLLTGPVIAIIVLCLREWRNSLHVLRLAGIVTALVVLLAGGLLVSVKIGGGSNLHNLDAYLILLITVGGYIFFGSYVPEMPEIKLFILKNPAVLALLLITPVWILIRPNISSFIWDKGQANRLLGEVRQNVEDISNQGGQVLFISQRQLLALKIVDVPLVPDYEQDFLTEMAMSHNLTYLSQFHADIQTQRFAGIVADAQNVHFYGKTRAFGEENDIWVQEVSIPLLCYYEPLAAFKGLSTIVYTPRQQPCK